MNKRLRQALYMAKSTLALSTHKVPMLQLHDTDQYIPLDDSADWFFGAGDFTWQARFVFDGHAALNGLMGQYQDASNRSLLYTNTSQQIGFYFESAGSPQADYISTGVTLTVGEIYMITVVRAGTSLKIYLDNNEVSLTTNVAISTNSYPDYSATFDLGRAYVGGALQYHNGAISAPRIWGRSMSAVEVAAHWDDQKVLPHRLMNAGQK